jgi:hypothetical protein
MWIYEHIVNKNLRAEEAENKYDSHVSHRCQWGILDAKAEQSHEQIEAIKRQRRINPWSRKRSMIAYRDEEGNVGQHAGHTVIW